MTNERENEKTGKRIAKVLGVSNLITLPIAKAIRIDRHIPSALIFFYSCRFAWIRG